MDIYLVIITTVLVLTQIIRLIQNAMQLKRLGTRNDEAWKDLKKIAQYVDKQPKDGEQDGLKDS